VSRPWRWRRRLLSGWDSASAPVRQVDARLSLTDGSGRILFGTPKSPGQGTVRRTPDETGLPWTLTLNPGGDAKETDEFRVRRRLLSTGLVAIVMLLAAGSYLLWRLVQRELAGSAANRLRLRGFARVPHPLTSLGHFTELLQRRTNRPPPSARCSTPRWRETRAAPPPGGVLLDFARMDRKASLRSADRGRRRPAAQVVERVPQGGRAHASLSIWTWPPLPSIGSRRTRPP
jgi:hypothetical protein